MSWSQDYSVPSLESLLEQLTKKKTIDLLSDELTRQGAGIKQLDNVVLDDNDTYGPIHGTKVTLTDGRVFIPKLKDRLEENDNHGLDVYEYFLENETPTVTRINADTSNQDIDTYTIDEENDIPTTGGCDQYNCGCEF